MTTREPEDGMIECAIEAFRRVLLMDADESVPETSFAVAGEMSKLLAATKKRVCARKYRRRGGGMGFRADAGDSEKRGEQRGKAAEKANRCAKFWIWRTNA